MLLSIIVPVYNVEKYLPDCLDSLLMQDISPDEYEIICVNDGSTDSSPAILEAYAAKHANIRIIHQTNAGVSAARNSGIEIARGDYIEFVDSDDCIRPNTLGAIAVLLTEHTPQLLRFGFSNVPDCFDFRSLPPLQGTQYQVYSRPSATMHSMAVWQTLFRKDLIMDNHIRFVNGMKYAEDTLFHLKALVNASEKWILLEEDIYYYRTVATSAVHQVSPAAIGKQITDRFLVIQYCLDYQHLTDFRGDILRQRIYLSAFNILINLPKSDLQKKAVLAELAQMQCFPLKWNAENIRQQKFWRKKIYTLCHMVCFRFRILYNCFFAFKKKYTNAKRMKPSK